MSFRKVLASITNDSGLARDLAVNTFYFQTNDVGTPVQEATDIDTHINAFYQIVDQWLSSNVATTNALRVRVYNHEDAPPRVPLVDLSHTLTPATSALPNECAVAISYKENPTPGMRRQRQRGRIYIGPLGANTMIDGGGDMEVESSVAVNMADAFHDQIMGAWTGATSLSTIRACVFSRSQALGLAVGAPGPALEPTYTFAQLAAGYREIDQCWVDDRFDTQRRRGLPPTTRTIGA